MWPTRETTSTGPNPESGIAGYYLTTAPAFQLSFIAEEPFGSGSGPQCIVEDPSDQFIYEANQYDSTVTGRIVEPDTGDLNDLRVCRRRTSSRGRHRGAWLMGAQVSAPPRPPAANRQRLADRSSCQVRTRSKPARIDGLSADLGWMPVPLFVFAPEFDSPALRSFRPAFWGWPACRQRE